MNTIEELEKYLEDVNYSFHGLTIGKHFAQEGYMIEKNGIAYEFSYSERGRKNVIRSFESEKELVEYAYEQLVENQWNRAHLVACVWSEREIIQAERELEELAISFARNDVPNYSEGRRLYRIFVFGKDAAKLTEFKKKYLRK